MKHSISLSDNLNDPKEEGESEFLRPRPACTHRPPPSQKISDDLTPTSKSAHSSTDSSIIMGSLEVEVPSRRPQNPYGQNGSPSHAHGSSSNARLYFMLCLMFFTLYGIFNLIGPTSDAESFSSTGDAAGGWGIEHNHAIEHHDTSLISAEQKQSTSSYYSTYPPVDISKFDNEFLEEDFIMALTPIISIPSHARPEYEQYQTDGDEFAASMRSISELLADKNTAHGKAYDFIVNRDKRNLKPEDPQLIQRFVLTLLFYATGGHDENNPAEETTNRGGWDSDMAHFLSGLHECHWVKKSLPDQFWEFFSMEGDDEKVGVTKCNDEMEVTEIRLGL